MSVPLRVQSHAAHEKSQHVQEILTALEEATEGHQPDLVCNAALWLIVEQWRRSKKSGPRHLIEWLTTGVLQAQALLAWNSDAT